MLFLEKEEIFVTLITYKVMFLRTVYITVSLSLGALCHLPSFVFIATENMSIRL